MNNENNLLEFFMGKENADHLYILIVLVILDYITGICVAIHQKRLSSKIGFKGISLKVMIFVVLSMCHVLDGYLIGDGSTIQAYNEKATDFYALCVRYRLPFTYHLDYNS